MGGGALSWIQLCRFTILLSSIALPLFGQWDNSKVDGLEHEAFVTKGGRSIILQTLDKEPTQSINQKEIPAQPASGGPNNGANALTKRA